MFLRLVAKSPKPEVTVSVRWIKRGGKVDRHGEDLLGEGRGIKKLWLKSFKACEKEGLGIASFNGC